MMQREKFSFLHTYESTGRYWCGLGKAGLIRQDTGIRLVMAPWGGDEHRFNAVAAKGGDLYKHAIGENRPLIVDRLVGGSPYHAYQPDAALMAEYERALGGRYLGMQIHEPLCNIPDEWVRLLRVDPTLRDHPVVAEAVRRHFDGSDNKHWLQYGTVDDYAGWNFPATDQAMRSQIDLVLRHQIARAGGHFTVCDGHVGDLAWFSHYQRGARCCMAEVGVWSSKATQFMIAALRGAAKAAGQPWGVFFAPWGPGGCTCFIPPEQNTWHAPMSQMAGSGWPISPTLGPSSALQRRLFFYSYLAGAHYLYEEWGAECNLLDWDTGKLSSYGQATAELLDFQEAHPDIGVPFTPLALELDASVPPPSRFHEAAMGEPINKFYPPREIDLAWSRLLLSLYGTGQHSGVPQWSGHLENACLCASEIPDLFDVMPSAASDEVRSSYRRILSPAGRSNEQWMGDICRAAEEYSPFDRATDLTLQINRREADGAWIVGLHNPRGARRGDVENSGSILNDAFTAHEVLHARAPIHSARLLYAWPAATTLDRRGDDLHVTVGPGGSAVLEIT